MPLIAAVAKNQEAGEGGKETLLLYLCRRDNARVNVDFSFCTQAESHVSCSQFPRSCCVSATQIEGDENAFKAVNV
jgi:hypothetical protein